MSMQTTDNQKELFIVVDRDDTIIGYKTRAECHADKGLIHRAVNLLIYHSDGSILLQKRSLTKDTNPGYWTVSVSGHVSKGESYEQSLAREMREELGIHIPFAHQGTFVARYTEETEMEALYTGTSDGPFHPNLLEVSEVKYFALGVLASAFRTHSLPMTGLLIECLKRVGILM